MLTIPSLKSSPTPTYRGLSDIRRSPGWHGQAAPRRVVEQFSTDPSRTAQQACGSMAIYHAWRSMLDDNLPQAKTFVPEVIE